ncbi:MAG: RNA polymerase sigma factor [Clostridiales bacterium]|jgi:RNA polymerase sigma-70 factor (ECF subfamily)|nr:RNA polymerase sigma factor [Clostridiales bacterium]
MEDKAILEMFCKRDEAALIEARRKFGGRLYKTALNILRNNQDAEEIVSDTLLKAWQAIPPVSPESLGAYLAKITRNLALNRWEAAHSAKRGGGIVNLLLDELEECAPAQDEPEEAFEAGLITTSINACLGEMKQAARGVFVLRYFHGESIADVAKQFQMSESKVKSMLHRARKKLGVYLEKEGIKF